MVCVSDCTDVLACASAASPLSPPPSPGAGRSADSSEEEEEARRRSARRSSPQSSPAIAAAARLPRLKRGKEATPQGAISLQPQAKQPAIEEEDAAEDGPSQRTRRMKPRYANVEKELARSNLEKKLEPYGGRCWWCWEPGCPTPRLRSSSTQSPLPARSGAPSKTGTMARRRGESSRGQGDTMWTVEASVQCDVPSEYSIVHSNEHLWSALVLATLSMSMSPCIDP